MTKGIVLIFNLIRSSPLNASIIGGLASALIWDHSFHWCIQSSVQLKDLLEKDTKSQQKGNTYIMSSACQSLPNKVGDLLRIQTVLHRDNDTSIAIGINTQFGYVYVSNDWEWQSTVQHNSVIGIHIHKVVCVIMNRNVEHCVALFKEETRFVFDTSPKLLKHISEKQFAMFVRFCSSSLTIEEPWIHGKGFNGIRCNGFEGFFESFSTDSVESFAMDSMQVTKLVEKYFCEPVLVTIVCFWSLFHKRLKSLNP